MSRLKKYSRKREAVLEALRATKTHPSAVWLYEKLRKDIPDLSLGTVYRNLSLFREEGLLISVGVVNGQERFDANTDVHAHFVCLDCARVIDVDAPVDEALALGVEHDYGFEVLHHQFTLYGRCDRCKDGGGTAPGQ